MIIHSAPQFQIYFGDAKDQMYPQTYQAWKDQALLERPEIQPIAQRLHLENLLFLQQKHTSHGFAVSKKYAQHLKPFEQSGDFLITQDLHLGIGILTADCLPVIAYDPKNHAIGIAHAGWKGAVGGIVPKMLSLMKKAFSSDTQSISFFFGPSAKTCCYEVAKDFQTNLEDYPFGESTLQKRGMKTYFDLPHFVTLQLLQLGISPQSIKMQYNACTICDIRFHSHRRFSQNPDKLLEGRQMTIVTIK